MTYDAYNSFKSPLISQANYKYKILGMYAIAALAIGLYYSFNAFTFASTAQYCFLLTSSAIFLLILLILVYKMRNQLRYYRKHGKTNILFKQILRIQVKISSTLKINFFSTLFVQYFLLLKHGDSLILWF
jgi:hypothetical protein